LVVGDAVAIEIRLQVTVGPGVKGSIFGSVRLLSEVASERGIASTTGFRGRGVGILGLFDELLTVRVGVLLGLLSMSRKIFLKVVDGPSIKGPGRPSGSGLVFVQADLLQEFISLAGLRDWNTTRIQVSFEARV